MQKILLSGSLTYDYIMSILEPFSDHILPAHLDKLNLSLVANTLRKTRGGTAANIAYTMYLLETPALIIGELGSDGREYLDYWKQKSFSTRYIRIDTDSLSPSVYIVSDRDSRQITTYYGGINSALAPHIHEVTEEIDYVVVSPSAYAKRHLAECAERGVRVIFDPGQISTLFTPEEFRDALIQVKMFIGNEYETAVMLEKTGWSMGEILKKLELVICTKGKKGSELLLKDGSTLHIAACKPKKVLDPTGAGDAYRGGFLAGLARGFDLQTCAQMGSVAGTYCVESYGCQEHIYTPAEFCDRYKMTYKQDLKI